MPNSILIVVAVLTLFLGVIVLLKKLSLATPTDRTPHSDADYEARQSVLTPAERSFFGVLQPLLPEGVTCLIKVRLEDVFAVRKDLGIAERARARNRIAQKRVDFLLVRGTDLKPLGGIELDDASHETEGRRQRDAFVDGVFQSGKVALLHIKARESYHPDALRESVGVLLARTRVVP